MGKGGDENIILYIIYMKIIKYNFLANIYPCRINWKAWREKKYIISGTIAKTVRAFDLEI